MKYRSNLEEKLASLFNELGVSFEHIGYASNIKEISDKFMSAKIDLKNILIRI